MPGFIVHQGATVLCMHGGTAMPTVPSPRVTVSGQPVSTMPTPYVVAGCGFVAPTGTGPCTTAQWVVGSTRVATGGMPLVLMDSVAVCVPTGTGLIIAAAQTRVNAT